MIRVLLADDHAIVRQGLNALLSKVNDIQIVGQADNGRDALRQAELCRPDVIVMDFSMPGLNGLEGTRAIVKQFPKTRVLILTMHTNEEYILQCMRAGAAGYLLKDSVATELIEAIYQSQTSDRFICPHLPSDTLAELLYLHEQGNLKSPLESLTARQREVLQLIAEGLTNKGIAQRLSISVKTVETHRAHIMNKLNIHDQAGLTRFAIVHGIIDSHL